MDENRVANLAEVSERGRGGEIIVCLFLHHLVKFLSESLTTSSK